MPRRRRRQRTRRWGLAEALAAGAVSLEALHPLLSRGVVCCLPRRAQWSLLPQVVVAKKPRRSGEC